MELEGRQQEWHSSASLVGPEFDVASPSNPTHFCNTGPYDPQWMLPPRLKSGGKIQKDIEAYHLNIPTRCPES
ncbi:hypothetical protein Trydic_g20881 [Trypoxylus dichotomus]